jgi:hypothetical protein
MLDEKMTNLRIFGILFFGRKIIGLLDRPFHIRLPRAKPDLADQNIPDRQISRARRNRQLERTARFERCEFDRPFPAGVRLSGLRLAGQCDRHAFARFRPTPHRNRFLALQDHVIGKNPGEPHLRRDRHGRRQQPEKKERRKNTLQLKKLVFLHRQ